jgi:hypothetical protein
MYSTGGCRRPARHPSTARLIWSCLDALGIGGGSNEAVEETRIKTLQAVYLRAKEAMDPAGLGLVGYGVRTVSCSGISRHLPPGLAGQMVR